MDEQLAAAEIQSALESRSADSTPNSLAEEAIAEVPLSHPYHPQNVSSSRALASQQFAAREIIGRIEVGKNLSSSQTPALV